MLEITKLIGANIKRRRDALGHSQEAFAQLIGIPYRTFQNIELGNNWPELPNLKAIARGLGVAPEKLFSGGANQPTPHEALEVVATALGAPVPTAGLSRPKRALIELVSSSTVDDEHAESLLTFAEAGAVGTDVANLLAGKPDRAKPRGR